MSELLKAGQTLHGEDSGLAYRVEGFLGGGGQGEVYRVNGGGNPFAGKWYFPDHLSSDPELRGRLEEAVKAGPPHDRFLWPMELLKLDGDPGFGYVMPLREERFKSIIDLMKRRIDPSLRALATAGFELANSYLQLHAKGLCYRDISFGNVFFDPLTGEVRICDNDNVDINGRPGGILGTPRFMAPEVVRGDAEPSADTDRFSLAVLLFYMLVVHHPLEGKKEMDIHCLDLPAMTRLYGTEPVFIFDPNDSSNRPVPGYQDNAIRAWQIYPQFIKNLFIQSFTEGLRDPRNGRVRETIWRDKMIELRDSILYCRCGAQSFYDLERMKATGGDPGECWSCHQKLSLPYRIRIGDKIVMLNHDTQLFPHHLDKSRAGDFSRPVAAVGQHPHDRNIWGLRNLSDIPWTITSSEGAMQEVKPSLSVTLARGTVIHFGNAQGQIGA